MLLLERCKTVTRRRHRNTVIQLSAQMHRLNISHGAKHQQSDSSAIQVDINESVLPLLVPSETFEDSPVVRIVVHDDRHGLLPSSGLSSCFSRRGC
jgi:hypothetical protein